MRSTPRASGLLQIVAGAALLGVLWTKPAVAATALPGTLCERFAPSAPEAGLRTLRIPQGAVVGSIEVRTLDVFDSTETAQDRSLFRVANRLHVKTQERVVRARLLFREGEPYDARKLQESERLFRSLGPFYDACIEPLAVRGNRVDVLVITRDVWTLGVGAGFERKGGDDYFQAGLRDSNFLGSGRFVSLKYSDEPERSERYLRFSDEALIGQRTRMAVLISEKSDGYRRTLDLERPFYSLDTRWAVGTRLVSDSETARLYRQGNEILYFRRRATFAEVRGGISAGYRHGRTRRLLFGYTFSEQTFGQTLPFPPSKPIVYSWIGFETLHDRFPEHRLNLDRLLLTEDLNPGTEFQIPLGSSSPVGEQTFQTLPFPLSRTIAYPWIGFETVHDRYLELRNLDRLVRTEDLNLGTEFQIRLGYSSPMWGGEKNQAIVGTSINVGYTIGDRQLLLLRASGSGRFGGDGSENVLLGAKLRYFLPTFGRHRLLTTVEYDTTHRLDPEKQLLIGGDSGLRGYPRYFQDGDNRFLLSIEHRFYTNWEIFNLIHVGAAVFFDAGRAWYGESHPNVGPNEVLRSAGIGLRLGSSRSTQASLVHFDVAIPLDGNRRKIQWSVTSRDTF